MKFFSKLYTHLQELTTNTNLPPYIKVVYLYLYILICFLLCWIHILTKKNYINLVSEDHSANHDTCTRSCWKYLVSDTMASELHRKNMASPLLRHVSKSRTIVTALSCFLNIMHKHAWCHLLVFSRDLRLKLPVTVFLMYLLNRGNECHVVRMW